MNWGNRIVLAFACFAAFIGYMVVGAFQEDFDLVAEDYYAKELNFEQKMIKRANMEELGKPIEITQAVSHLELIFPEGEASGTIEFYHPSREMFDRSYPIALTNGAQKISKEELVPGNYRVNIHWSDGDRQLLHESKVYIQ